MCNEGYASSLAAATLREIGLTPPALRWRRVRSRLWVHNRQFLYTTPPRCHAPTGGAWRAASPAVRDAPGQARARPFSGRKRVTRQAG